MLEWGNPVIVRYHKSKVSTFGSYKQHHVFSFVKKPAVYIWDESKPKFIQGLPYGTTIGNMVSAVICFRKEKRND